MILIAVLSAVLTGCGSAKQAAADSSALTQLVSVRYDASVAAGTPQQFPVAVGKVVYVAVSSNAAGTVSIPSYGLSQPVAMNGQTVLVFSANNAATVDVDVSHGGEVTTLAQLNVTG